VRRETQNVLLVLVGGALLKITFNGTYLRYVKPSTRPWVTAAGVIMVALAVVAIVTDIRESKPSRKVRTPAETGADSHHHGSWSSALLILPVLAIFLVAPPALGADSVIRSDSQVSAPPIVQQGAAAFPPLPSGSVVPLSISEFITRSVWDSTQSLDHRLIQLDGFVVHQHGSTYVARLVITCCAADAVPMRVDLRGGTADTLPDDQWIEVTGTVRPGSATQANGYTPTLDVNMLRPTAAPADPYEY